MPLNESASRKRRTNPFGDDARCSVAEKESMTDTLFLAFVFNDQQRDTRCTYVTSCSPLTSSFPCFPTALTSER